MKFVVDTTNVAKGFRDYKSAVEGIFASLDKFEAHVNKTMQGVAKASGNPQALGQFRKNLQAFGDIKIDGRTVNNINKLGTALHGFKAPSAAQNKNARAFFKTLNGLPDLSAQYKSAKAIGSIATAMNGFKAPSSAQSKRLREFGKAAGASADGLREIGKVKNLGRAATDLSQLTSALNGLKVPSAAKVANLGQLAFALRAIGNVNFKNSGNFYAALGAISNFKAPSAGQIRNLSAFVTSVGQMKVPANADRIASALHKIGAAGNSAAGSMRNLRGGMGPLGRSIGTVGKQARGAQLQMMGLQNAFSGTFQIGSALRSLFGALTIAELGRGFFEATNAALSFKAQMGVVNRDLAFTGEQLTYINETANRFGIDMLTAETGFAKVSIAAHKAGMSVMQTRHVFEGVSSAMTVLGTSTDRQNDVWLAVQQVMNKGYLSAEELNQQLNEHLPGAMAYAAEYAESLGMSLEKGLKTKALDADAVLTHIAQRMKEEFGPAVGDALERPAAQMNILKNNVNLLYQAIGEAGGNEAFGTLLKTINEAMNPEDIERYAQAIGQSLKNAVESVTEAFIWLRENWDSIRGPLATTLSLMAKWMLISGTLQIGRFLVTPILQLGGALTAARGSLTLMTGTLPAANAQLAKLSGTSLTLGTSLVAARRSMLGFTAAMALAPGVAGKAAVAFTGLRGAVTGVAKGMGGLVNMLGGPYMIAFGAITYAAYDAYDAYSEYNDAVASNSGFIESNKNKLDESIKALGLAKSATGQVTGQAANLTLAIDDQTGYLESYRIKMDEVTGGLWSMAEAARAARIEMAAKEMAEITSKIGTLSKRSSGRLEQDSDIAWAAGNYYDSIDKKFRAFGARMDSELGFTDSQDKVTTEIRALEDQYAQWNNFLNEAGTVDNETIREGLQARGYGPPSKRDRIGSEAGGKGAGKKAASEAAKLQREVDSLAKSLMEHDPLDKLYADFVKTLTDQGEALLSDKAIPSYLAMIRAEGKAGALTVNTLIEALQSGHVNPKVMQDLARYGIDTVDEVIDYLRAQQQAFDDELETTIVENLDKKYKTVKDMMGAFGDVIPALGEAKKNIDELTTLARIALDPKQFGEWATEFRSGAVTADEAASQLIAVINDPALRSPELAEAMRIAGVSSEEMAESIMRGVRANAAARTEAEDGLDVFEQTLRKREEEIKLLGVTSREADILLQVQEAVNAARAAGQPVTEQRIAAFEEEIRLQQDLADQMKRNKEFFENNGVRSYINDVQSAGEAINELDKNVLQSLEDQLFSLGTTGTFSFNAIFDTIQQGLVRFASQGLVKGLMENMFSAEELNGGTPSLMGSIFKSMGFEHEPAGAELGTMANPMYVEFKDGSIFGKALGVTENGDIRAAGANVSVLGGALGGTNGASPDAINNAVAQAVQNGSVTPSVAANDNGGVIAEATEATAASFGDSMTSMMPMIGMAFASSFKSPIAQIGVMLVSTLLPKLLSSIGGGGGMGGGIGGIIGSVFGGFKEGGLTSSPVTFHRASPGSFANAPHYAEGTANTSGGIPAILHDNEAVIPLSRGRKVPVEMAGGGGKQQVVNNWNISTPDADSFKKSRQQMVTDMHMVAARSYGRNRG